MIKITYNENEEMMRIEDHLGTVIFLGNYADFDREPTHVKEFLEKCGLNVLIKDDLPAIG